LADKYTKLATTHKKLQVKITTCHLLPAEIGTKPSSASPKRWRLPITRCGYWIHFWPRGMAKGPTHLQTALRPAVEKGKTKKLDIIAVCND